VNAAVTDFMAFIIGLFESSLGSVALLFAIEILKEIRIDIVVAILISGIHFIDVLM
jgi:hypothetical protein